MTEPTEQKKVRFLVFAPEGAEIYGLDEAVHVLENHGWAEVTRTTDPQAVCNKLFAREVEGLVLLRPDNFDWKTIERVFLQWVSVRPEETYILFLAETLNYRDASWSLEWEDNIWLYHGFSGLKEKFFSFGELVRSKVK